MAGCALGRRRLAHVDYFNDCGRSLVSANLWRKVVGRRGRTGSACYLLVARTVVCTRTACVTAVIIDFQQHYTPPELLKGDPAAVSVQLDENGNPNYLLNPLLADLPAHLRMMDA